MMVFLLLAAGSSSRMGQPKMLLPYMGKTLLQHILDQIISISNSDILVVTGFYDSLLKPILLQQQIPAIKNEQWQDGMGSSIQTGITYIMQHYPSVANVIILVCDQPFISTNLLQQMLAAKEASSKGIVACSYNGTNGTPVLFDKKYFNQLANLHGAAGAKNLVKQFASDTITISFPKGGIDIDSPDDYKKLLGD